ncbi:MAG TPA: tyrosine-type recombinase/integrase [Stellaceae bacterium]|nr:tyrosine-type recombinase/integrase [Stellaceae bacterium]
MQPGLTFRGLRHTVGKKLAEAGCDARTIAAVLGHQTEDMARHYAKQEDARRRTSAAIRKLERKADKSVKPQR